MMIRFCFSFVLLRNQNHDSVYRKTIYFCKTEPEIAVFSFPANLDSCDYRLFHSNLVTVSKYHSSSFFFVHYLVQESLE